jgi:hypothetical protein
MASILLPTVEWTPSCEQVRGQLGDEDELIVICDAPDDPVAERFERDSDSRLADDPLVDLVVAGDPEGCSGKANALAAGLERAAQNRVVFTDDDLDRGDDWLATMKRLGEEHGAASAVPVFVSDEFPYLLVEPLFAVFASGGTLSQDMPWGGGVTFDRRDIDEEAYLRDLRRTLSDDELLVRYLDDPTASPELVHEVRVDGGWRGTYHRVVRFFRTVYLLEPDGLVVPLVASLLVLALSVVWLPAVVAAVTALAFAAYRHVGIDRRTWVLAYPSFLLIPAFTLLGVVTKEFEWGGRRYRWRSAFDVEVLD